MKFSIVVPVYNVERYIRKCLESILKQSYDNFEVIIVNDGSIDESYKIIDEYVKRDNRFKSYKKRNGGLSDARNYGVNYATGDYLLFIDSDDYIAKDLLLNLKKILDVKTVDLVAFNSIVCDDDENIISKRDVAEYVCQDVNLVIKELITRPFVETAWIYCYRLNFWKEHNFEYKKGMYHEDYGLTPLIIYEAKTISSINYFGYYYVQREGSITKNCEYSKVLKKVNDFYNQYLELIKIFNQKEKCLKKDILISYMSECLILKLRELNDDDYKKYVKFIKKDHVVSRIKVYNFKKFLKKIVAFVSPKLYVKIFFNRSGLNDYSIYSDL